MSFNTAPIFILKTHFDFLKILIIANLKGIVSLNLSEG